MHSLATSNKEDMVFLNRSQGVLIKPVDLSTECFIDCHNEYEMLSH